MSDDDLTKAMKDLLAADPPRKQKMEGTDKSFDPKAMEDLFAGGVQLDYADWLRGLKDLLTNALILLCFALVVAAVAYHGLWIGPTVTWYSFKYDVATDKVYIAPQPTDCDFWHAPVGLKDCHYERVVDARPRKFVDVTWVKVKD